ncbi:MAG: TIGR04222 domain-containing membrane protein, partial [Sphaerospermopsis sp. SIO1G2]|nr:TIGR04222 domain-containing membrane protein [Sphaerospermopsis sp. SIO1G2]
MNIQQTELYQRIQEFSLDKQNANLSFSKKLAQENNWTPEYTQRAIAEYKKFAFIAAVSQHPVSPSDTIDQVWHLHLTYTQSYWQEFCPLLGIELHHFPSDGSNQETEKFSDWFLNTINSYHKLFGENPPADIWFNQNTTFQRIDTNKNWVITKPNLPLKQFKIPVVKNLNIYLGLLFTFLLTTVNSPIALASSISSTVTQIPVASVVFFLVLVVIIL